MDGDAAIRKASDELRSPEAPAPSERGTARESTVSIRPAKWVSFRPEPAISAMSASGIPLRSPR